jgi:hypothetical protein
VRCCCSSLDSLSFSLDALPNPQVGHGERLPSGWQGLNSFYEERFGIPREQATPPPSE